MNISDKIAMAILLVITMSATVLVTVNSNNRRDIDINIYRECLVKQEVADKGYFETMKLANTHGNTLLSSSRPDYHCTQPRA